MWGCQWGAHKLKFKDASRAHIWENPKRCQGAHIWGCQWDTHIIKKTQKECQRHKNTGMPMGHAYKISGMNGGFIA